LGAGNVTTKAAFEANASLVRDFEGWLSRIPVALSKILLKAAVAVAVVERENPTRLIGLDVPPKGAGRLRPLGLHS
jgi:hypothetical protein